MEYVQCADGDWIWYACRRIEPFSELERTTLLRVRFKEEQAQKKWVEFVNLRQEIKRLRQQVEAGEE